MNTQATTEAGTPVYSVTVEESRRVTISRTYTILGGTPDTAKAEAEGRTTRGWAVVAELGGFSLGPVEKPGEINGPMWALQHQINQAASAEGWALFDYDGSGFLQIQRDDEADKFPGDEEAILFVRRMARTSDLHRYALVLHRGFAPFIKAA